jgi:DDE superfamily endonuclease
VEQQTICLSACLDLWLRRRWELRRVRSLRVRMLPSTLSLANMSAYDVVSKSAISCFGPFEGRRHDMHLYAESDLDDILGEGLLINGTQYHLYGDSWYALRPSLITPFEIASLTTDEALFHKRMSKVRVSVEWAFKDMKKYFSHIAVPRKMVLSRTPAGAWYLASCLLWNFRCCLEGSPTSMFFYCTPPS